MLSLRSSRALRLNLDICTVEKSLYDLEDEDSIAYEWVTVKVSDNLEFIGKIFLGCAF